MENEDTIRNIAIIIEERDTTLSDTTSMFIPQIENYIVADTTRHKKNKWQFLATGSLGSALAQNVYKLIASNNNGLPDPDGPTPIIPMKFQHGRIITSIFNRKNMKVCLLTRWHL